VAARLFSSPSAHGDTLGEGGKGGCMVLLLVGRLHLGMHACALALKHAQHARLRAQSACLFQPVVPPLLPSFVVVSPLLLLLRRLRLLLATAASCCLLLLLLTMLLLLLLHWFCHNFCPCPPPSPFAPNENGSHGPPPSAKMPLGLGDGLNSGSRCYSFPLWLAAAPCVWTSHRVTAHWSFPFPDQLVKI